MYIRILIVFITAFTCASYPDTSGTFPHFITRSNDTLFDGNRVFRFISFNVPNLHLLEDDFSFTATNNWSLTTTFEINDALQSVAQAGGMVVRIYCLRIRRQGEPDFLPMHITDWRTYYEPSFRTLDTVLALAARHRIRLIIPILEGPPWWGPKREFARLHGGLHGFESRKVRDDYKHLVGYLLNRRNGITGTLYKDDKTVLCWETGNEMRTSGSWLAEMAAYIKSIDGTHLVMDGNYGVRRAALDDPNVDIVSNHFYKKDAAGITRDLRKIAGKKVYIIGEWGWSLSKAHEVINQTVHSSVAGALIWSVRPRYRTGGFTWHKSEGLHWPGGFNREELPDEQAILTAVRNGACSINGTTPPPFPPPAPPVLLPVNHPSAISWQGSAGATRYTVERAPSADGPWITVGDSIDETVVAYRPLFSDTVAALGDTGYYRVIASGPGGTSAPSIPYGPLAVNHSTLVDELLPDREKFSANKGTRFTDNRPWRYKYDFHRRKGKKHDYFEYTVNGNISIVRLYAFFPKKRSDFILRFSTDGNTWSSAVSEVTEYPYCCANPKDRLRLPVLFEAKAPSGVHNRVRVFFPGGGGEAGRVEIDYRE
ncbi:MAG: hypothetical protein JW863_20645 [Chitinispirillaceae bacterium]|nr:hypothetical protein [Chitinispirillaceae bacterium]